MDKSGILYCDKCHEPVDRPNDSWWEVVGFAKQRKQGGLHALKLSKKTGTVVCSACMVRLEMDDKHGPGAQPLF